MTSIRQLAAIDNLDGGDQVPVYAPTQGDARRFSLTTLVSYLTEAFTSLTVLSHITTTSTTVAGLPSAATAGAGARAMVTNANATTFNSIVAGGGANIVPVFSDGTNWRIG